MELEQLLEGNEIFVHEVSTKYKKLTLIMI